MRKLRIVWTVCCLAIGLSACATTTRQPSQLDTAKACADWRWIGISQPEAPCPEVAGWTVRPMFPQLSPPSGDSCGSSGLDVIRNLNRFCVYEIKGSRKKLKDLELPSAASAGLVRFDQDCAALSLTATEMDEEISKPDSEDFLAQVGGPQTPAALDYRPTVRLAFLDTQPTGEGVPVVSGNSRHGFTLAQIARQMVCSPEDDDRCAAQITTRLALPIIEFNSKDPKQNKIDRKKGGYLGMQGDLATAIVDEVRSWHQKKSQRHLVLNLSMAWDGDLFGGLDEGQVAELRAGSQAVYNALQYAARFDVLVLAAAGNRKVDPCTNDGPLLPAAWEKEAPSDSCRTTQTGPLLYAVGGLKSGNAPLDNARPGGMPQRVAYGEASIFSGSSVATAVASSIAAVVWNAFPQLDSRAVMKILDASGPELFPADFWFDPRPLVRPVPPPPLAHKLMLCSALMKAYEQVHGCGTTTICEFQCDPREKPETIIQNATKDKKAEWLGSCQPWLFPQPEDTPRPPCCEVR